MAAKKRGAPSRAATRAAKALCAPSPEMVALSTMVLRMTESIIQLEKTVDLLAKSMCHESRRNAVLHRMKPAQLKGTGQDP